MGLYMYVSALCAAFSGFSFGYDVGSLNGVKNMVGYRSTLNLSYVYEYTGENSSQTCSFDDDIRTSSILGLITALHAVGGVVGSLCGGPLSDHIGRKPVLMLGGCLVGIGGLIHTAAVHISMVLIGRLLAGLGTGAAYIVTPVFIGEIIPEKLRGRFLSFLNLTAVCGYMLGIILDIVLQDVLYGWRIVLSFQCLGGVMLALLMIIPPRSPRWLVSAGKDNEAKKILYYIYNNKEEAERNLMGIKRQTSEKRSICSLFKFVIQWKVFQRLLMGYILVLMARLTGGSFVGYFSVSIFCKIGLPGFMASISIAVLGIITMVITSIVIDKLGRKLLFLIGLGIMLFGLAVSSVLIIIFGLDHLDDTSEIDSTRLVVGYICLILICIFTIGFNSSCGCIPFVLMGELFPLPAKGFVTAICLTAFWKGIVISNQVGAILINSPLQISGTLLVFMVNTILLFLIVLFCMPETKGILLEDIDKLYRRPWKERVQFLYYIKCLCLLEVRKRTVMHPVNVEDEEELKSAVEGDDDDEGDSTSLTMLNCEENSINGVETSDL